MYQKSQSHDVQFLRYGVRQIEYAIPETNSDYIPISIFREIEKVFERIIARQICEFIEKENILKETMSGFRKSHSTTAILLKLHYDILKSMNRGEITVAIFADYSKVFDTVNHSTILQNQVKLGFDKVSVKLICSYLCETYQYVQIKEKPSSKNLLNLAYHKVRVAYSKFN